MRSLFWSFVVLTGWKTGVGILDPTTGQYFCSFHLSCGLAWYLFDFGDSFMFYLTG
jgi:hypothetical protein